MPTRKVLISSNWHELCLESLNLKNKKGLAAICRAKFAMVSNDNCELAAGDAAFQFLCSQINADYTAILRRDVVSYLDSASPLRLRELRVLMALERFSEPTTSAAVTSYLRYDPGTVSRALASLRKAGYVTRVNNRADRRSPFMRITPRGSKMAKQYQLVMESHFAQLARQSGEALSDAEKELTMRILVSLRNRVQRLLTVGDEKQISA